MHPLGSDLTQLSDSELQERISELYKKRLTALQVGSGQLVGQIDLFLFDCNQELADRNAKFMQKIEKKSATDLDKLIDVKKK